MKGRSDDAGPDEPIVAPSKLVENILALLEEAGTPTTLNDAVVNLIETWEYSQQDGPQEPNDCPACMGYGYFDENDNPSLDKRGRKCLDCTGTGIVQAKGYDAQLDAEGKEQGKDWNHND